MSDKVSVHISETGDSPFAVTIATGQHRFVGDEPPEKDGADLGPSPYQLLVSALGECTAMTIRWYARQQKWPLDHVAVDVTHEKAAADGKPGKTDLFRKSIHLKGPQLTDEQRKKLVEIAAKCPVQRTLEGTPSITTIGPA